MLHTWQSDLKLVKVIKKERREANCETKKNNSDRDLNLPPGKRLAML